MSYKEQIEFYKNNPDKYIETFYGIKLFWYQKLYLKIMLRRK